MKLPDFVIAGVAKAGTTSLYAYLCQHPRVYAGTRKELNFFALGDPVVAAGWPHLQFPATTWEEYLAFFAAAAPDQLAGEASPIYFDSPLAIRQIARRLPRARVIVSLRDPRERAYSGYLMHVRAGHPPLPDEAIAASGERFIAGGFYHRKLCDFREQLGAERLKIVLFDDLRSDPAAVVGELYDFLGLEGAPPAAALGKRHNPASYPRSHRLNALLTSPMVERRLAPLVPAWARRAGRWLLARNRGPAPRLSADLRARLTEVYRDDVIRTQELIGRDLSGWLAPAPVAQPKAQGA